MTEQSRQFREAMEASQGLNVGDPTKGGGMLQGGAEVGSGDARNVYVEQLLKQNEELEKTVAALRTQMELRSPPSADSLSDSSELVAFQPIHRARHQTLRYVSNPDFRQNEVSEEGTDEDSLDSEQAAEEESMAATSPDSMQDGAWIDSTDRHSAKDGGAEAGPGDVPAASLITSNNPSPAPYSPIAPFGKSANEALANNFLMHVQQPLAELDPRQHMKNTAAAPAEPVSHAHLNGASPSSSLHARRLSQMLRNLVVVHRAEIASQPRLEEQNELVLSAAKLAEALETGVATIKSTGEKGKGKVPDLFGPVPLNEGTSRQNATTPIQQLSWQPKSPSIPKLVSAPSTQSTRDLSAPARAAETEIYNNVESLARQASKREIERMRREFKSKPQSGDKPQSMWSKIGSIARVVQKKRRAAPASSEDRPPVGTLQTKERQASQTFPRPAFEARLPPPIRLSSQATSSTSLLRPPKPLPSLPSARRSFSAPSRANIGAGITEASINPMSNLMARDYGAVASGMSSGNLERENTESELRPEVLDEETQQLRAAADQEYQRIVGLHGAIPTDASGEPTTDMGIQDAPPIPSFVPHTAHQNPAQSTPTTSRMLLNHTQFENLTTMYNKLYSVYSNTLAQNQKLTRRVTSLKDEIDQLLEKYNNAITRSERSHAVEDLQKQLNDRTEKVEMLEKELSERSLAVEELQKQLDDARNQLQRQESMISNLQNDIQHNQVSKIASKEHQRLERRLAEARGLLLVRETELVDTLKESMKKDKWYDGVIEELSASVQALQKRLEVYECSDQQNRGNGGGGSAGGGGMVGAFKYPATFNPFQGSGRSAGGGGGGMVGAFKYPATFNPGKSRMGTNNVPTQGRGAPQAGLWKTMLRTLNPGRATRPKGTAGDSYLRDMGSRMAAAYSGQPSTVIPAAASALDYPNDLTLVSRTHPPVQYVTPTEPMTLDMSAQPQFAALNHFQDNTAPDLHPAVLDQLNSDIRSGQVTFEGAKVYFRHVADNMGARGNWASVPPNSVGLDVATTSGVMDSTGQGYGPMPASPLAEPLAPSLVETERQSLNRAFSEVMELNYAPSVRSSARQTLPPSASEIHHLTLPPVDAAQLSSPTIALIPPTPAPAVGDNSCSGVMMPPSSENLFEAGMQQACSAVAETVPGLAGGPQMDGTDANGVAGLMGAIYGQSGSI
ncbi:hypothetical protein HK104_005635 [Borealophlyctis nickersoniae]|nr:hypothetical protein HK104_005635 [Borealophlyctis nickersoniae]